MRRDITKAKMLSFLILKGLSTKLDLFFISPDRHFKIQPDIYLNSALFYFGASRLIEISTEVVVFMIDWEIQTVIPIHLFYNNLLLTLTSFICSMRRQ